MTIEADSTETPKQEPVIVPARIAKVIAKQLRGKRAQVSLGLRSGDNTGTRVVVRFEDTEWTARTIEGEFPNEALRSALSLYAGEFCNDRYYPWVGSVRDRFRNTFLRAAAELAELLVDSGDFQQAVDVLDLAIQRDPLCEDIARQAIRVEASLGRRIAATRRYRKLREVLRKELGVDPDPDTQALMRQIERPTLAKVSR